MTRTQTMVQLSERLVEELDREATRRGVSRSALIRSILEGFLQDGLQADLDRRIVDGYKRVPPGTPDEWGDLEAFANAAAADTMRRLDAEERKAGLEPW